MVDGSVNEVGRLKSIRNRSFLILPMCLFGLVAIGFGVAHFSDLCREDRFIAHWVEIFSSNRSLDDLRGLPQVERPDLIYIREFENGQWFAARTEHACGGGAGFDATVFADSEGTIRFQKGYHFCGHDALRIELEVQGITNLAGLYPNLKEFGLREYSNVQMQNGNEFRLKHLIFVLRICFGFRD